MVTHNANVNQTDEDGRTALIAASYMGHSEIIEYLLDNGAEIDHQDADGRTALSVAALCVPNRGSVKVVNILLEKGAFVDHQDKDGMTPLLVAAFEGHRLVYIWKWAQPKWGASYYESYIVAEMFASCFWNLKPMSIMQTTLVEHRYGLLPVWVILLWLSFFSSGVVT